MRPLSNLLGPHNHSLISDPQTICRSVRIFDPQTGTTRKFTTASWSSNARISRGQSMRFLGGSSINGRKKRFYGRFSEQFMWRRHLNSLTKIARSLDIRGEIPHLWRFSRAIYVETTSFIEVRHFPLCLKSITLILFHLEILTGMQ